MDLFNILIGTLLIGWGRKLFWLFVAWLGFMFAFQLAGEVLGPSSDPVVLVVALIIGFAGAMAAIFLEKLAIGIAGAMAGGYLCMQLASVYWADQMLLAALIGCILGMVLMYALFEGALIFLSSLVGASMVSESLGLGGVLETLLLIFLTIAGISIQTRTATQRRKEPVPVPAPARS